MIKHILTAVQSALMKSGKLRYIGEDWGQLDDYEMKPVSFPCALIGFQNATYHSQLIGRQDATLTITVRIASMHVRSSSAAPDPNSNFDCYVLANELSGVLHGLGDDYFTPLVRQSMNKSRRNDGVKELVVTFATAIVDDTGAKRFTESPPNEIEPSINM